MSSKTNRPPLKTYSKACSKRKHQDATNDTLKRRCVSIVEDDNDEPFVSSDPPSADFAIFSDQNVPPSTPPSSPPSLAISPRAIPLKLQALDDMNEDQKPPQPATKPQKRLVQMQLNFGQSMRKTCKDCGMEYIPSAPEDAALHRKFHAQHTNGVSLDRDFLKRVESEKALWRGPRGAFIMSLSGSQDPKPWLKKARAVFDMATSDLGAVDIPDEKLWGLPLSTLGARRKAANAQEQTEGDRYKMYLYVDGGRCVGLCLAECIGKAFKVLEPKERVDDKEKERKPNLAEAGRSELLSISNEADKAIIGISRIWTSRRSRKKGIAKALLKCVAKTFVTGAVTDKDMMAFSQPTEMGTSLAKRWFGREYGWHVYID